MHTLHIYTACMHVYRQIFAHASCIKRQLVNVYHLDIDERHFLNGLPYEEHSTGWSMYSGQQFNKHVFGRPVHRACIGPPACITYDGWLRTTKGREIEAAAEETRRVQRLEKQKAAEQAMEAREDIKIKAMVCIPSFISRPMYR
jgi:hypothetical protein